MSQQPGKPASMVELEPVLVLSHSYTYYAPREILTVRLGHPMAVTLGTAPNVHIDVDYRTFHIRLADIVEDRVEGDDPNVDGRVVLRNVPLAEIHAAIVLHGGKLYYKHLGGSPSVLASRGADARIVQRAGVVLPLEFGQSVGLGSIEDAFGQPMWWYYIRVYPLRYLKRQVQAARAAGR